MSRENVYEAEDCAGGIASDSRGCFPNELGDVHSTISAPPELTSLEADSEESALCLLGPPDEDGEESALCLLGPPAECEG